jgi:hypothetical protein
MDSVDLRVLDPFDFQWSVPAHGFHWIQAYPYWEEDRPVDLQWFLVLKKDGDRRRPPYQPLSEFEFLGLFRVFSEVKLTRESILEFANEYSALGLPCPGFLDHPWPEAFQGETLEDWAGHIERMRQAVEIWDLLRAEDKNGLRRLISWRHRTRQDGTPRSGPLWWWYRSHPGTAAPNVNLRSGPPWPGEYTDTILAVPGVWEPGDLMTPARFFLAKWVTDALQGVASPELRFDRDSRRLKLQIIPKTLLAAMWVQFARAIDTDKTYRRCKACTRWFEVSAGNSRTDRQFCSDPCKSRDYRAKKQEAIRLRGEKWTPKQIAKQLGTDVETVKGWINRAKEH